jgi:hypothetical protein
MNTRRLYGVPMPWIVLASLIALLFPAAPPPQAACTFPETGQTVGGRFLAYWNTHGGLAQQGYPISGEMREISETDGKPYTVQYFERAVFELHPENTSPNDVLLSLLGVFYYRQRYPQGAPNQVPNTEAGARLFPETGKHLGGRFLDYWNTRGGLAQQGYPISDEFTEVSALNGKPYTVQYFERAVFEYHPENAPPYDVLLSQLGTFRRRAQSAPPQDAALVGAGDIADCGSAGTRATAQLLTGIPGTVVTLGDNAYPAGTAAQYRDCYDPTWGQQITRTRPVPGNHEYVSPGAAPYYAYFGEAAGARGQGYYSYNLGAWHIVALNSNIAAGDGSAQARWLQADLAANPATCALAYWHHPVFSSGQHGNNSRMQAIWRILYAAHADVVLNGHDHDYERFAPMNPDERADPAAGIREFVVGTGGAGLRSFSRVRPNSEVRDSSTWGVIKLTLHPAGYDWEFIPVPGRTFRDSGSAVCVR